MKYLYVVKKFVMAATVEEAMRESDTAPIHEVFRVEDPPVFKQSPKDGVGFVIVGDQRVPYEGQQGGEQ